MNWEHRFWSRVSIGDGCWEWLGCRDRDGYGLCGRSYGSTRANRVVLILANGPIPPGLCALHRCDNPSCVRPSHLFLGTHADNSADSKAKGRHARGPTHYAATSPECLARGERNGLAKLTRDAVVTIRRRRSEGATYAALAAEFGISHDTARDVCVSTWRHVT